MNRVVPLLALVAVAATASAVVSPPIDDGVINGDFELFVADQPVGWVVWEGTARATDDASSGALAVALTPVYRHLWIEQPVPTRALADLQGEAVEMSFSVKSLDPGTRHYAYAGLTWTLGLETVYHGSRLVTVTDAYERHVFIVEPPPPNTLNGVPTVRVDLASLDAEPGEARFLLDDVVLRLTS